MYIGKCVVGTADGAAVDGYVGNSVSMLKTGDSTVGSTVGSEDSGDAVGLGTRIV